MEATFVRLESLTYFSLTPNTYYLLPNAYLPVCFRFIRVRIARIITVSFHHRDDSGALLTIIIAVWLFKVLLTSYNVMVLASMENAGLYNTKEHQGCGITLL